MQQECDSRIDYGFPVYASGEFQKGVNAGFGSEDLASLIKVLRAGA